MVMTVGNLPTSFVASMSYYEALAWLCNYLETQVIPTVNNNISTSFECKFTDIEKREFEIPFTADLFSYHYMGGWFIDPCYTSANVKAKIAYNFDKNKIVENYLRKHPEPVVIKSDGRIKIVD